DAKIAEPGVILDITGVKGLPPALTKPFMLGSSIDASAKAINLPDIAASLGDDKATGKIAVQMGTPLSVDAALAFGRLDLDKLLPQTAPAAAPAAGATGTTSATPAAPSAAAFALPGGVTASFDLSAEAVIYHQGVIDHPHLAGRLTDGELQIKQI